MANGIQKQLQFLMYSTPDEDVKVSALVKDETIWLTQKAMGELFGVNVPANSLSRTGRMQSLCRIRCIQQDAKD